ncbi:MAG: type II toxin-antitoxin system HicA family toxin [Candidatus Cloacimonetes bacterium]|nr:type II toxin-antitoxin system HicA family toxin [Candidatus Cloacimonadota bacterium]
MPKLPRSTADEAEKMLLKSGFEKIRTKGSHRIYLKSNRRIVIPFHKGKLLHPKIIKQVFKSIENEK